MGPWKTAMTERFFQGNLMVHDKQAVFTVLKIDIVLIF